MDILRQVVDTLKEEYRERADYRSENSLLGHLSNEVSRLHAIQTSPRRSQLHFAEQVQRVFGLVYEEINEYKYPKSHSICRRLMHSDVFALMASHGVEKHASFLETRLQLIRVVATELEHEFNHENMMRRGRWVEDFPGRGVSERCAALLTSNRLSSEDIYREWCILFSYIRVSKIRDAECLKMCCRILSSDMFESEHIRMYTDTSVDTIDVGRVKLQALAAAVARMHRREMSGTGSNDPYYYQTE